MEFKRIRDSSVTEVEKKSKVIFFSFSKIWNDGIEPFLPFFSGEWGGCQNIACGRLFCIRLVILVFRCYYSSAFVKIFVSDKYLYHSYQIRIMSFISDKDVSERWWVKDRCLGTQLPLVVPLSRELLHPATLTASLLCLVRHPQPGTEETHKKSAVGEPVSRGVVYL